VIDDFASAIHAMRAECPDPRYVNVGVVAVAEPDRGCDVADRLASWSAMDDYTELLSSRTALRARPLPMTCGDPRVVAERVCELAPAVAVVVLVGVNPADSVAVQNLVAARDCGPVVVPESDLLTAALAAAAVTMLRRRAVAPRHGRVAVTGADRLPRLEQVLYRAGAGSVATFYQPDASALPIGRLLTYHDILIDLTGTVSPQAAPGRVLAMPRVVSEYAAVALPGVLSAVCGHDRAVPTVDVLAAAARAIALITPTDRLLPALGDHSLVSTVARHVGRVLADRPIPVPPYSDTTRTGERPS